MKKKIIMILLLIVIIIIIPISLLKNNKKSINTDDLALIHYKDFKIIVENKNIDEDKILRQSDDMISLISKHIDENSIDNFIDNYTNNLTESIKIEWDKINKDSIGTYYISEPISMQYITKYIGDYKNIFSDNSKFIIIKAVSEKEIKYIYIYPYSLNNSKNNYILDLSGMYFIGDLKEKTFNLLRQNKLKSIRWIYDIPVS